VKIQSILVAALATGSLCAAVPALELDARIQVFGEMTRPVNITFAQTPANLQDKAGSQTGIGVRFMGEIASAPNWYYELGGKMDATSNFGFNGTITPPAPGAPFNLDLRDVRFTSSYWSLGFGYLTKPNETLTVGFHVEARGEALSAQGKVFQDQGAGPLVQGVVDASTTYLRPWIRLSADATVPVAGLRPYVGVDAALALTKTSQTELVPLGQMDNRTLKSMAPTFALSVYLGMRF